MYQSPYCCVLVCYSAVLMWAHKGLTDSEISKWCGGPEIRPATHCRVLPPVATWQQTQQHTRPKAAPRRLSLAGARGDVNYIQDNVSLCNWYADYNWYRKSIFFVLIHYLIDVSLNWISAFELNNNERRWWTYTIAACRLIHRLSRLDLS